MLKLVVMVEKDDTGKLWDYTFAEKDGVSVKNSFETTPLLIHKTGFSESDSQRVQAAAPAEKDFITMGVIPLQEEAQEYIKVKKK